MDTIAQLSDRVVDQLRRPSADSEVVASVQTYLADSVPDYEQIQRADAYESFALSHLKREAARYRREDDDSLSVTGVRDDPLCLCSDPACPLKAGELPRTIRKAEDLDAGILAFKREHNAYSPVLDEMSDEWSARRRKVQDALLAALQALHNDTVIEDLPAELFDSAPPAKEIAATDGGEPDAE